MLFYWYIQSSLKAQHQRDFPIVAVKGGTQWIFATFLKEWSNIVLNTKTKELFIEGWNVMKGHIPTVRAEYIHNRWLDPHKEKFVGAYITHIRHYGQISFSKGESAHSAFKKSLDTSQLIFFSLSNYEDHLPQSSGKDFSSTSTRHSVFSVVPCNVLFQLYGKISTYSRKLMNREYLAAEKKLLNQTITLPCDCDLVKCDGLCMFNVGLCCRHDLLQLMLCGDEVQGQVNPLEMDA